MEHEKMKVLIVDDEPRIINMYKRMLEEAGVSVLTASNGEDATERLIREKVDLVLLDINMPEIDGKTVYEIIQEYDPTLKVIISSVYPVDVQKKMIPHAYDYHDKSQGYSILLDKVFKTH